MADVGQNSLDSRISVRFVRGDGFLDYIFARSPTYSIVRFFSSLKNCYSRFFMFSCAFFVKSKNHSLTVHCVVMVRKWFILSLFFVEFLVFLLFFSCLAVMAERKPCRIASLLLLLFIHAHHSISCCLNFFIWY